MAIKAFEDIFTTECSCGEELWYDFDYENLIFETTCNSCLSEYVVTPLTAEREKIKTPKVVAFEDDEDLEDDF